MKYVKLLTFQARKHLINQLFKISLLFFSDKQKEGVICPTKSLYEWQS